MGVLVRKRFFSKLQRLFVTNHPFQSPPSTFCLDPTTMGRRKRPSKPGNSSRGARNHRPTPTERYQGRLLPTDRFQRFCKESSLFIDYEEGWPQLREIELVYDEPSEELLTDDAIPLFPADFRWEQFSACWTACEWDSIRLYTCKRGRFPARFGKVDEDKPPPVGAAVLWLSDTVFLSAVQFSLTKLRGFNNESLFHYGVSFSPFRNKHPVFVYSLSSFTISTAEEFVESTPPDLPLHFFKHVASVATENFMQIHLYGSKSYFPPRLCELFLSILPPKEINLTPMPQTSVALFLKPAHALNEGYQATVDEQQLEVVAAYRFNSQVKLHLEETSHELLMDRVNQLLRESLHIRHLSVNKQLSNFEGNEISFSSNPAFISVWIENVQNGEISKNLLDGLAMNTGIQSLDVTFSEPSPEQEGFRKTLEYLCEHVLPKCRSLRNVTLDFMVQEFMGPWRLPDPDAPYFFREKILKCIADHSVPPTGKLGDRFGSLVSLRVVTKRGYIEPPSQTLNRIVWPPLSLSWCRQSRNEHSWATSAPSAIPAGLVPSAIRAVNPDVVYVKTTGLDPPLLACPFDSRTANAGVIYDVVRSFHPTFS
jgi:hypothetical protein